MNWRQISKAIAAATAAAIGGAGTAVVSVPVDVPMPWWGYLAVGVLNAALTGLTVYFSPANAPAK